MSCGIGKGPESPYRSLLVEGLNLKEGGFREIQIFFKTSSSSKEALLKVLKPPSSTLEVYKEQSSVGSSLNAPLEFFNNTLKTNHRYSSKHQITKGFMEIQIFFKTSSSSKEALFSSKEDLSKVLKPPSSTLEVYKEQSSVGSSLKAPLEFFNNTLKTNQRYSSKHQITKSC
jgi:hypothetical protein